jgi:lipopolysaccharide/colanic/teichoic acid biosynthesis glycosyltransferase
MKRRLLDVLVAGLALTAASPLLLIAAVGIRLSSPGPVLYFARRIGRDRRKTTRQVEQRPGTPERRQPGYRGREFTMYKFRTMHVGSGTASPITAHRDSRVFPFGAWLRATKIDELPQLFNVLKGDMALVGPRPEAPEIVRDYYSPDDIETLQVPPGLTSPGALYYYTHCEPMLGRDAVLDVYVQRLLPLKMALDRVYVRRATFAYDVRVLLRTIRVVVARSLGIRRFPDPPELRESKASGDMTLGASNGANADDLHTVRSSSPLVCRNHESPLSTVDRTRIARSHHRSAVEP